MANTTWNPSDKTALVTLTNGNLTATAGGTTQSVRAANKQITGKFYFEMTTAFFVSNCVVGMSMGSNDFISPIAFQVSAVNTGFIFVNGTNTGISIGTIANGTLVCFAVDLDARLIWFRNGAAGNWNNNAGNNPATGVGGVSLIPVGGMPAVALYPLAGLNGSGAGVTANFGDTAFTGTVPSGFTSGFPAGATPPLNALATQVTLEMWSSTTVVLTRAEVTQVALEQWFLTSPPPPPQVRAMIIA